MDSNAAGVRELRDVKTSGAKGMAVWDAWDVGQRKCALWRFPCRLIYLERVDVEWHALSLSGDGNEAGVSRGLIDRSAKARSDEWRHYLLHETTPVQPVPVMPDRALVVRPDRSLTLLAGETARFFLDIPVWFRLETVGARRVRIFEEPLRVLSNTWFGDPVNGELCYVLPTRLHQDRESLAPSAWHAVCPLAVTNDSETDLAFERICLHVENLAVFRGARRLWTNRIDVVFRGTDQASNIQVAPGPPPDEEGLQPASPARQPADSWDIRKTFSRIREFAEF